MNDYTNTDSLRGMPLEVAVAQRGVGPTARSENTGTLRALQDAAREHPEAARDLAEDLCERAVRALVSRDTLRACGLPGGMVSAKDGESRLLIILGSLLREITPAGDADEAREGK